MTFKNLKEIVDAIESGAHRYTFFRKTTSVGYNPPCWIDLSMLQGSPGPNYYASTPLEFKPLSRLNGGIYHGSPVAPMKKYVKTINFSNALIDTCSFILLDYLGYYPFIDEADTTLQFLDNTSTLPRFEDGEGVKIMCVSQAARSSSQQFTLTYTNSQGVSGRSATMNQNLNAASLGSILSSDNAVAATSATPFFKLQEGDTGVRSIESVQMLGPNTGLMTLALVKPICTSVMANGKDPNEKNFITDSAFMLPEIHDDAYLNFIMGNGAFFSTFILNGYMETIFN
jgi:hypothetical protein